MSGFPRQCLPRTITAQITSLIVAAVLAGVGLTLGVDVYFSHRWGNLRDPDIVAAGQAARIAAIIEEVKAASSPAEVARVLSAARRAGNEVQEASLAHLPVVPLDAPHRPPSVGLVMSRLQAYWGIVPLGTLASSEGKDPIVIQLNPQSALIFRGPIHFVARQLVLNSATLIIAIIAFIILFLSVYAVRWITAPLSTIASAAHDFGRSGGQTGVLREDGPREIAQVAEALNEMRSRIRALADERTRTLAAISHDLRTPLARLGLRAERVSDSKLRGSMLRDIALLGGMLDEALAYLREGGSPEPIHRVDLPSLLQTICAEFIDVGNTVSYEGPGRLTFACRQRALTRAITNVIENGTKHGSAVTVALHVTEADGIRIDISDDGPGIPKELMERVFEPFFKADPTRSSSRRSGFGLGLSIARDIVRSHDGEIELLDHTPQGVTVRITLNARWAEARSSNAGSNLARAPA
jgi:signal transduction histidine kinase